MKGVKNILPASIIEKFRFESILKLKDITLFRLKQECYRELFMYSKSNTSFAKLNPACLNVLIFFFVTQSKEHNFFLYGNFVRYEKEKQMRHLSVS